MSIRYLEVEDEITTAVARIRNAGDPAVLLVLPVGSRLATSRINFRLLAAEARGCGRMLAIATPEPTARALAVAAGIPAYASVAEYEAAIETSDPITLLSAAGRPRPEAPHVASTALRSKPASATPAIPASAPARAPRSAPWAGGRLADWRFAGWRLPDWRLPGWRLPDRRLLPWVAGALLLLVLAVGGAAAAVLLPSAEITVHPRVDAAGPVVMEIVADPGLTATDPEGGTVQAERLELPLRATDRFDATGLDVRLTKATGTVRFRSENTLFDVTIPPNTQVSTPSGIAFVTTQSVVVPRASFATGPTTRTAPVEAVEAGPSGNVPAGSITREPQTLRAALISVTNPAPTDGGRRIETRFVARSDYDAAVERLTERLDRALQAAVADRAQAASEVVVHPTTARRGPVAVEPLADEVVGQIETSFELVASATGTVTAVDEPKLRPLAETRLRASLPGDRTLMPGSIEVEVGEGVVEGDTVRYTLTARGRQWRRLDAGALLGEVRGRPVEDARARLSVYGDVEIATWPSFVESIPSFDGRASLVVVPPTGSLQ